MEDSSHELIDQMISKEQYCYGFETISSLNNTSTLSNTSSQTPLPVTHTEEDVVVKKVHMSTNNILENKKEAKPKIGKITISFKIKIKLIYRVTRILS